MVFVVVVRDDGGVAVAVGTEVRVERSVMHGGSLRVGGDHGVGSEFRSC